MKNNFIFEFSDLDLVWVLILSLIRLPLLPGGFCPLSGVFCPFSQDFGRKIISYLNSLTWFSLDIDLWTNRTTFILGGILPFFRGHLPFSLNVCLDYLFGLDYFHLPHPFGLPCPIKSLIFIDLITPPPSWDPYHAINRPLYTTRNINYININPHYILPKTKN